MSACVAGGVADGLRGVSGAGWPAAGAGEGERAGPAGTARAWPKPLVVGALTGVTGAAGAGGAVVAAGAVAGTEVAVHEGTAGETGVSGVGSGEVSIENEGMGGGGPVEAAAVAAGGVCSTEMMEIEDSALSSTVITMPEPAGTAGTAGPNAAAGSGGSAVVAAVVAVPSAGGSTRGCADGSAGGVSGAGCDVTVGADSESSGNFGSSRLVCACAGVPGLLNAFIASTTALSVTRAGRCLIMADHRIGAGDVGVELAAIGDAGVVGGSVVVSGIAARGVGCTTATSCTGAGHTGAISGPWTTLAFSG